MKKNKLKRRLKKYSGTEWNKLSTEERKQYLDKGAHAIYKEKKVVKSD